MKGKVKLGERELLDSGSVKYPVKVFTETGEKIVDTTYTVSRRQEENLEKMVTSFAERRIEEYNENKGEDHSNREISL